VKRVPLTSVTSGGTLLEHEAPLNTDLISVGCGGQITVSLIQAAQQITPLGSRMPHTLFFSWQSDTPAKIGLELVEEALGLAIAALAEDAEIEKAIRDEGLMVDRDTQGVPGVPPIVDTIFDKIDAATIFVPDLTFVATRIGGRPTPNPNVLVEYGWALKALTYARIVPVMNVAFGEPTPETMPFDMRHLRHPKCTYNLPEGASDEQRRTELARLVRFLAAEIRDVLRNDDLRAQAQRAQFPASEPKDGQARFRARGEPLGTAGRSPLMLAEGPAMWLRMMPQFDPGRQWLGTDLEALITPGSPRLFGSEAFGSYDANHMFSNDGCGVYVCREPISCVVYLFKTGEIWAIDAHHLRVHNVIPVVEPYFIAAFENYTAFLREKLQIAPPYKWIAGVEGVQGRPIEIPRRVPGQLMVDGPRGSCMAEFIVKEGTHVEGAKPSASLHPFFAELYDSCNVKRPDWMNDWTWPPMRY
jgi:hypothetical protein